MHRKILLIIIGIGLVVAGVVSCKKNNETDSIITPPSYAEFTLPTAFLTGSYYIKNESGSQYKIPVGLTTVSNVDRKIIFKDSSRTAVPGQQYSVTDTVIIPAGKVLDSLTVKGIYNGFPPGRKDTLYISIVGGDVPANAYNNKYTLIMQGYCDVISDDLIGDFANSVDYYGSAASAKKYTATVTDWTSTGATSATATFINLGATHDNGWGPYTPDQPAINPGLKATIDWSDPAKFSVTIPKQDYFDDGSGMSTVSATGTFSSCSSTFTIKFTVAYAGDGNNYTTTAVLSR